MSWTPWYSSTKKTLNLAQRSFKVIPFATNRQIVCDFTQTCTVNSNFSSIVPRMTVSVRREPLSDNGSYDIKTADVFNLELCRTVQKGTMKNLLLLSLFLVHNTPQNICGMSWTPYDELGQKQLESSLKVIQGHAFWNPPQIVCDFTWVVVNYVSKFTFGLKIMDAVWHINEVNYIQTG